jgi:hypothetical protein
MPNVQIAFSNSANPDEFAANVYKVMMTRNDNSVANAIDAMANSNSLYQGVNIKQVPELQALYKRVLSHNGPISQQDLANSLNSLFPNAVPGAEQQQYVDANNKRQSELLINNELNEIMKTALRPYDRSIELHLTNGQIWPIIRQNTKFIEYVDNEAQKSINYQKLVEVFNQKYYSSMEPKETLEQKRNSSSIQEFVQKIIQFAKESRIDRLDIALQQYGGQGGTINGVNILTIPAIQQLQSEIPTNLDANTLITRLTQMTAEGQQSAQNTQQQPQQPQQQQSVSQMYGSQDLRNYQSAMDMQINSLNTENAYRMAQSYIATFQIYDQYLRQNNITDPNYSRYQASYKAAKKVQPRQSKQPNTDRSA